MYGNHNNSPIYNDNTPRLPPIRGSPDIALRFQDQVALIDRNFGMANDDRRARQMLEDQLRVISSVCKKLNQDIEALDSQMNEKTFAINNLEYKTNDLQANNLSINKDLQFKMARHDNILSKLEGEHIGMQGGMRELQIQLQDQSRSLIMRMNDIEGRIMDLNSKFDSILTEQTMVLKNVEGDTVKQLQLLDGKTRTMLEDVRSQLNQSKANHEADLSRLEARIMNKIDESQRNNEKYDRIDRKLEEYTNQMNKRFLTFEDEFQRNLNKLASSTEKLEHKVNKGMDDKFTKTSNDSEKLKRELKLGFENVQESIVALQKVVDGKIRLSEDKLEKELDKIRKMVKFTYQTSKDKRKQTNYSRLKRQANTVKFKRILEE